MALTALGALAGIGWYLRLPAAALTGIAYLTVSYFVQGAFKEPLLALLLLGFVIALRESTTETPRRSDGRFALILTTGGRGGRLRHHGAGVARRRAVAR